MHASLSDNCGLSSHGVSPRLEQGLVPSLSLDCPERGDASRASRDGTVEAAVLSPLQHALEAYGRAAQNAAAR